MAKLSSLQAYELKLENILRRYLGEAELGPDEFLRLLPVIRRRAKVSRLRAQAARLGQSANDDMASIVAGQPVMSVRDRNRRDKAYEKLRRAGELYEEADALAESLTLLTK